MAVVLSSVGVGVNDGGGDGTTLEHAVGLLLTCTRECFLCHLGLLLWFVFRHEGFEAVFALIGGLLILPFAGTEVEVILIITACTWGAFKTNLNIEES